MNRWMLIAPAVPRGYSRQRLQRLAIIIVAVAICLALLGCNQTPGETPPNNYGATVEALLPTADPTIPPTPTSTALPPTNTPAPTFTSRPRPTYTPWPTPTKATADNRQPAIPFNAQMVDGSHFALRDGFGSPTLLAFFAPW